MFAFAISIGIKKSARHLTLAGHLTLQSVNHCSGVFKTHRQTVSRVLFVVRVEDSRVLAAWSHTVTRETPTARLRARPMAKQVGATVVASTPHHRAAHS